MHAFPGLLDTFPDSGLADVLLRHLKNLAQIFVGKSIQLRLTQHAGGGNLSFVLQKNFLFLHQLLHLLDEVMLDLGQLIQFIHRSALSQSLVHDELSLAGGIHQQLQQLLLGHLVIIFRESQSVLADLQAADGFLESFLVGLSDAHHLAHGAHLGTQLILHAFELFKGPAGKFDYHIVAARHVFVQGSVFSAGNLVQGQAAGQHGGYQRDGESRGLAGQGGRTGRSGIDLDHHDSSGNGIVSELYVGTSDHLYLFHNLICLPLQLLLYLLGDGQHGSGAEGISRVHAQRVDILDEADGDHVVLGVPNHLQLQLFPAQDGLFHQHLAHHTGLQAPGAHRLQFFHIVYQTAAGAAHGVCRAQNHRIPQLVGDGQRLFHTVSHLAAGHLDAQTVHGFLKFNPILAALDGVHLHADHLHAVLVQDSLRRQLGAQVQSRLSAQIGQDGVRPLFGDNLLQPFHIQRFNIGDVRNSRIRHDGGRVGIHQHNLIPQLPQRLTCLGTGIVKLTGLADDDRAGTDDQYFMDIRSFAHKLPPFSVIFQFRPQYCPPELFSHILSYYT